MTAAIADITIAAGTETNLTTVHASTNSAMHVPISRKYARCRFTVRPYAARWTHDDG